MVLKKALPGLWKNKQGLMGRSITLLKSGGENVDCPIHQSEPLPTKKKICFWFEKQGFSHIYWWYDEGKAMLFSPKARFWNNDDILVRFSDQRHMTSVLLILRLWTAIQVRSAAWRDPFTSHPWRWVHRISNFFTWWSHLKRGRIQWHEHVIVTGCDESSCKSGSSRESL